MPCRLAPQLSMLVFWYSVPTSAPRLSLPSVRLKLRVFCQLDSRVRPKMLVTRPPAGPAAAAQRAAEVGRALPVGHAGPPEDVVDQAPAGPAVAVQGRLEGQSFQVEVVE